MNGTKLEINDTGDGSFIPTDPQTLIALDVATEFYFGDIEKSSDGAIQIGFYDTETKESFSTMGYEVEYCECGREIKMGTGIKRYLTYDKKPFPPTWEVQYVVR